uniref:Uncharacterized protein n=1 Tax=Oryza meridionalis TaxID=40149 RepID=A0A0E0EJ80_9ORYZ
MAPSVERNGRPLPVSYPLPTFHSVDASATATAQRPAASSSAKGLPIVSIPIRAVLLLFFFFFFFFSIHRLLLLAAAAAVAGGEEGC